ncbi:MAG: hypothetical protein QXJ69_04065 [Desulfurococcaceae archaeon]
MRLLGIADIYNKEGYLLIKPHVGQVLKYVGAEVHDSMGRKIGRVIDVIGRTDDPRLVVKLNYRDIGEFLANRKERVYFTFPWKARKARK